MEEIERRQKFLELMGGQILLFNKYEQCGCQIEWYHPSHRRLLLSSCPYDGSEYALDQKVYLLFSGLHYVSTIPSWQNAPLNSASDEERAIIASKTNFPKQLIIATAKLPNLEIYFASAYVRFSEQEIWD